MHKHKFSLKDIILFGILKTKASATYILQVVVFAGLVVYVARSVASLIGFLIMICLGISLTTVSLLLSRSKKTIFADLFKKYKGYEIFLNYFLASLAFAVLVAVGLIPAGFALLVIGYIGVVNSLATFSFLGAVLWLILLALAIPGAYLVIRLQFFKFFVVDKDMGAVPALKASWKITDKNVPGLAYYLLSVLLVNILVLLVASKVSYYFIVVLLVTIPVMAISSARLYDILSGDEK